VTVVLVGGAGFVGLNIAEVLLGQGRRVLILDRAAPPDEGLAALGAGRDRLDCVTGDVTDAAALAEAMPARADALVLGAAITAGPAREAADPEAILAVNLGALAPLLRAARGRVGRIVNLGSVAAYGPQDGPEPLDESVPARPETLYAVTKLASEGVAARLAALWALDLVSVRLSSVFGPFERDTGVRDTLSPHGQVTALARAGGTATLPAETRRDWIYATDVAEAVAGLIRADALRQRLFNVSTPRLSSALDWGEALAPLYPGFSCRLAEPGEAPTVAMPPMPRRPPIATARLAGETGWSARFDLAAAAADTRRRDGETSSC
jgi:UDP-glucose 4-epimerase